MWGGARGERSQLLVSLNAFNSSAAELDEKNKLMQQVDEEIRRERELHASYAALNNELGVHERQLNVAKLQLEQTDYHQKLERCQSLKACIEATNKEIAECKASLVELGEKKQALEAKLSKKVDVEAEKKLAQKRIDEAKRALDIEVNSTNSTKQVWVQYI